MNSAHKELLVIAETVAQRERLQDWYNRHVLVIQSEGLVEKNLQFADAMPHLRTAVVMQVAEQVARRAKVDVSEVVMENRFAPIRVRVAVSIAVVQ